MYARQSFSPKFQGFDFEVFQDDFPFAKISAVSDNMAAALGVAAHDPNLTNALVIVLGTAPAVATFFRDASWSITAALFAHIRP